MGNARAVGVARGAYLDSVRLMALAGAVERLPGVNRAWLVMATEGALDLLVERGFDNLPANLTGLDCVLALTANDDAAAQTALRTGLELVTAPRATAGVAAAAPPRSLRAALATMRANVALISVPGLYAAAEARKALDAGLHVFLFSDNVPLAAEAALKRLAKAKGLLLMGPDCGTALLDRHPLGFMNAVRPGSVGLVGASGTGIQEVAVLLHRAGAGLSQAIGVGGRDLHADIGGIATLAALGRLAADPGTCVLVIISKPPAPDVAARVLAAAAATAAAAGKPLVVCFVGSPAASQQAHGQQAEVFFASTLARCSQLSAWLALTPAAAQPTDPLPWPTSPPPPIPPDGSLLGLFCGGTLCSEARAVSAACGGVQLQAIDLGGDEFTCGGRAHPMIDSRTRGEAMAALAAPPFLCRILLVDCVLGHGAASDGATALAEAAYELLEARAAAAAPLRIVASVTGTELDPQCRSAAMAALLAAGCEVAPSNAAAALAACTGVAAQTDTHDESPPAADECVPPLHSLLASPLAALSLGAPALTAALEATGVCRPLAWVPPALGDAPLGALVAARLGDAAGQAADAEALRRMLACQPVLVGCRPATELVPCLRPSAAHPRTLLHAGPPVTWDRMCGPQRGAAIGACLLESWAADAAAAEAMLAADAVRLQPCHDHGCVGPMAGVISPSMSLWVVEDAANGSRTEAITASTVRTTAAYAPLNEGLGAALRFGAHGAGVLERLRQLNGPIAAALDAALRSLGGLPLSVLMAKALHSGDELHNRCTAATSLLARHLSPALLALAVTDAGQAAGAAAAAAALRDNDHTFLNVCMAACKLACDAAHGVPRSALVTAMARNGTDFGIRLSGTGAAWFTAPAPRIQNGVFFPGFSDADAGLDMGDSAITETAGLGGFCLAAAPAIAAFVGGTAASTRASSEAMYGITLGRHPGRTLPALDFAGAPVGIDPAAVLDCGEAPVINTGIAHRLPGIGQVGAGITHAPLACFAAALNTLEGSLRVDM